MESRQKVPAKINFQARNDGSVDVEIYSEVQRIAKLTLSQTEVGSLVSQLLRTSGHAFESADRPPPQLGEGRRIEFPISATNLQIGITSERNQKVIVVGVGEASIGFLVSDLQLRELGRSMLASSWDRQSSIPTSRLLNEAVTDFRTALIRWASIVGAQARATFRRRANACWSSISGQAFYQFCTIKIGSDVAIPKYAAVGKCIYCDAPHYSSYSKRTGLRESPFGGEHIVPEGIGGSAELPEASCQRCEEITGALVEGRVLGRTLKALRVHLNLKKSGSGAHPKTLPLDATVNGIESRIDVPTEEYPIVFTMLLFPPPDVRRRNAESGKAVNGMITAVLKLDQKNLLRKYGISSWASAAWDTQMFCRMLAKIGHSFAAAELGPAGSFSPKLLDFIVNGDLGAMNLIGGPPEWEQPSPSDALHEIFLGYQRMAGRVNLVAKIRLFARYSGATYYVVVGESLESPIRRWGRVIAAKIL